jgi:tetratricopeptide (TPR) repeat protein
LRDGDLRGAVAAYDEVLGRSGQVLNAQIRGTALLGRAMAYQLMGEVSTAFTDVIAALDIWRHAPAEWLALALTEIASGLAPERRQLAAEYWAAARRLAERSGDARLASIVAGEQGRNLALSGEAEGARPLFLEAEALARRAGADDIAAAALVNLARLDVDAGHAGEAARSVAEALSLGDSGPHLDAAAGVLIDIAGSAIRNGQLADAQLFLEQVVALGDTIDGALHERALVALTGVARERKDLSRALELGEGIVATLKAGGDSTAAAEALHDLGVTALAAARGDDAENRLLDALVGARRHRLTTVAAAASRALAVLSSRRGSHLRALGYAEQATSFASSDIEREACAMTLALVASEAERWQRFDVCADAHAGAAEIYRALGRMERVAVHETSAHAAGAARDADAARRRMVEDSVRMAQHLTD